MALIIIVSPAVLTADGGSSQNSITILCYMNGDNDLAHEVLHALDMMETEGSSRHLNVIALVDGHPQWLENYSQQWSRTRLLRLTADTAMGQINSQILEDWGEADLAAPETLERFVKRAISLYPADRYIFYTFAHSKGVIDTGTLTGDPPGKSLAISRDDSSRSIMRLDQFHAAIQSGLQGRQFDLMVLFSCLSSMVEVGYTFSDITHYMVGSEDEIRLLNQPPGHFQIRGAKLEKLIAELKKNSAMPAYEMGRLLVNSHMEDYEREVTLVLDGQPPVACRYAAGMALIDARAMPALAGQLDELARLMIGRAEQPGVAAAFASALSAGQQFASFLNLEYYDLQDVVYHLLAGLEDPELRKVCRNILGALHEQIILYERHTTDARGAGLSIYLSHPLVPQNIFEAHQAMYRRNRFSRDTQWDEMIECYRRR